MNMKTVAVISFVLFCFLCTADHQMGQIKLAEATSSRMPLIVSAKHDPLVGDIVVYRTCYYDSSRTFLSFSSVCNYILFSIF